RGPGGLARVGSPGGGLVSRWPRDILVDVAERRAGPRDVLHLVPHDATVRDRAPGAARAAGRARTRPGRDEDFRQPADPRERLPRDGAVLSRSDPRDSENE